MTSPRCLYPPVAVCLMETAASVLLMRTDMLFG